MQKRAEFPPVSAFYPSEKARERRKGTSLSILKLRLPVSTYLSSFFVRYKAGFSRLLNYDTSFFLKTQENIRFLHAKILYPHPAKDSPPGPDGAVWNLRFSPER
nr:hypothetical protein [uncultured Oscillibacter sp.]